MTKKPVEGPQDSDESMETRILEGTLESIGRHGLRKLGVVDVAAVAGVSRGTVYRYFPSKEQLLSALFEHERHRFERGANEALEHIVPGQDRFAAHIEFILEYLRSHPALPGLIETEPRYVLSFLDDHHETFRRATKAMLEPIFSGSSVVRSGAVSLDVISDLVFRVLLSFFLSPPARASEMESLRSMTVMMEALAAAPASVGSPVAKRGTKGAVGGRRRPVRS